MAGISSNDAWGKVLSIINGLALSRSTDGSPEPGENVWYWREQVFFAVFLAAAVLGSLTYFPTLLKSIEKQHLDVAVLYTAGYLGTLCVTFVWRIPYKLRAVLGLLFVYCIGVYTLNIVGLYGSGRIWLLLFSLLSALFLGMRFGFLALVINVLTMVSYPTLLPGKGEEWKVLYQQISHASMWDIATSTFIAINALSLISIALLMKGLEVGLGRSKKLRADLEKANVGLQREIEERIAAENALVISRERNERLLAASPDPIVMLDSKGLVSYANPAIEFLFGWRPDDMLGKKMPIDDLPELVGEKGGDYTDHISRTITVRRDDGVDLFIKLSAAHMPGNDTTGEGAVYVFHDFTESQKAEQERLDKQKLRAAIETAGAACHELNQPLQSALIQSELVLDDLEPNTETARRVESILAQIKRMSQITYNLNRLAEYHTKQYVGKSRILDVDRSAGAVDADSDE